MTHLVKCKDLDDSFAQKLGYKNAEDAGNIVFLSCNSIIEKNIEGKQIIHSISTDPSLDLHSEAMDKKFVSSMVKQVKKIIQRKRFFPQFSNHDFRWENMLAYAFDVFEENNQMHLKSIPNLQHPLSNTLISMLKDGAPIENSIVIARVKTEMKKHQDSNDEILHYVDGKIKSSDFVGIGANENTSVVIDKSFNQAHGSDIVTEKNMGSSQEGTDSSNKGESASDQVTPDHLKRLKEIEQTVASFTENTTKVIQEKIVSTLKEISQSVETKLAENLSLIVESKIKEALDNRKQEAMTRTNINNENTKSNDDILAMIDNITDKKALEDIIAAGLKISADSGKLDKK